VKHHRVKIYFDPAKLDSVKIQKAIFTPSKTPVTPLGKEVETVTGVTLKVDNFFDTYDFNYLARLLQQKTNAVGLISEFDCPIIIKIYFPGDTVVDENALSKIIETKLLSWEANGVVNKVKLNYKVNGKFETVKLSRGEYLNLLFKPFEVQFNDFEKFDSTVVKIFTLPLGENKQYRSRLNFLVSHLSNDDGIIELKTFLNEAYEEIVAVSYVDSMTNEAAILKALNSDSLLITYTSGEKGKVPNMFKFTLPADTIPGQK
ncbi:MAG TPA: hypothetical protein PLW67_11965, partial [Prolixibacteraceae bacterium]|nr:hypothetical protein [Prolixibacteraceae bacterium]